MTAAFIDTNVLLYAVSDSPAEADKKEKALQLLEREDFAVSMQVVQEFYANATHLVKGTISSEEAMAFLDRLVRLPVLPLTFPLFRSAVLLQRRYQISYWDAAILAATKAIGATTLYSEDLSHGQVYDGVRVVNPFLEMGVQAPPPSP
ncbi:MAG: PIN domain-containing protein [Verrucomicrobiales bacterium]|nr:PIN domain-containing protein [Verrucomicrobiales bacterium]